MAVVSWAPVVILAIVFFLIVVRRVGKITIKIWQAMGIGAISVLVTGQIAPIDALLSINLDVILFLFGMFVVGEALVESKYLDQLTYRFFGRAHSVSELVLLLLFVFGLLSAILMNDTIAIIGTPVVMYLSKTHGLSPKLMLLVLAMAVTTGSVMSPIGNPQNLLVATGGNIESPFITFFIYLALPTLLSILIAFVFFRVYFRDDFRTQIQPLSPVSEGDGRLALLSKISLIVIVVLILVKISLLFVLPSFDFRLTYIALGGSLPILLFSSQRTKILKGLDWATLVFFAAMFVLMASVWQSGFFQTVIEDYSLDATNNVTIAFIGLIVSQFISNVPLVALYLPLAMDAGATAGNLLMLAASSTIAGNMLILGAASNVIIIQNAEKNGGTLTFIDFAKIGIPLTLVQIFMYLMFLNLFI